MAESLQNCYNIVLKSYKANKLDLNCALALVKDSLWKSEPVSIKNIGQYNDIGYFLEQGAKYEEAYIILKKVVQTDSARTVAWFNLGDAQKGLGKTGEAKESYKKYIALMEQNGKSGKIPQRVSDYVKQN